MHNGTIISTITERAKASWHYENGPIESNPVTYGAHWLATGEQWLEELRSEGLTKTADTLDKHLEWFRRAAVK